MLTRSLTLALMILATTGNVAPGKAHSTPKTCVWGNFFPGAVCIGSSGSQAETRSGFTASVYENSPQETSFGQWIPVEDLHDSGVYEQVYNIQVADFHTYFVGGETWGFSVWSHNTCGGSGSSKPKKIGKFLQGKDVADIGAHAKKVGKVTGVVDRAGAAARRQERMKGKTKVPGKDLDEYPPAVIKPDNPAQVSVSPRDRTQNRRSGGRLRGELPPDGTPVIIVPPS